MLDIFSAPGSRTCDGVTRRNFLRVGALALGGLAMPDLLRLRAGAQAAGTTAPAKDTAVILMYLGGGPSHIDMYDMKPDAPAEIRGEFRPINSSMDGLQVCEYLPLQAKVMHRTTLLRSVTHNNSGHSDGAHTMLTGHAHPVVNDENLNPHMGCVVSRLAGPRRPGLPAFVGVPGKSAYGNAAYIGAEYNSFGPNIDPTAERVTIGSLKLHHFTPPERFDRRKALLEGLDNLRRDVDLKGEMGGLDKFYGQAMQMILSEQALKAFDLGLEDERVRDAYGRTRFGQSALMARRLVEAGVTFCTVNGDGWDTHDDNFNKHKKLFVDYDQALTALVNDLYDRGLDKRVLLVVMGEFGRTPRINTQAGRDHWPGAASVLFIGGGLRMGQIIGATDAQAAYPKDRPLSPGDVLSTIYHVLGVDWAHEFHDQARRPLRVVPEGEPIRELIA